jgi:hypothetical protein
MTHSAHIKYMILAGVAAFVGMWVLGVPLERALPFAFFLACPLMMLFMMRGMDHGGHREGPGGDPAEATSGDPERDRTPLASDAPAQTVPADEIALIDRQYRT